ncbi:MAG: hypothetical protein J6K53_02780 [Roseburia sp.]|nr:hypothetical protein [Roseburia sp.]
MMKEILTSTLTAVVITLAVIAGRKLIAGLNAFLTVQKAEAEERGNKAKAGAYQFAIAVLDSIAQTTVSKIETTQAAAVRKAVKAGEKEFTELTKLSDEAYQEIIRQLSPDVMAALEACVDDTEQLVRNKIEEVLPKVKAGYRQLEQPQELEITAE